MTFAGSLDLTTAVVVSPQPEGETGLHVGLLSTRGRGSDRGRSRAAAPRSHARRDRLEYLVGLG